MSDDLQRWKDKYLESLEQQERLEKRWEVRLDLLRRGLVRSSLAAEGSDRGVDQCMQELREIVRRDDFDASLSALIPRLEKAVLDSERRRGERVGQLNGALASLVTQLQQLPLPRDVRKALKRFARGIEERAGQTRELPALMIELSDLQRQALTQLENDEKERPGLLQRLFGTRDPVDASDTDEGPAESPSRAPAEPAAEAAVALQPIPAADATLADDVTATPAEAPLPLPEPDAEAVAQALPAQPKVIAGVGLSRMHLDSLPMAAAILEPADPAYALPAQSEPAYIVIAARVEAILLGMLDELPLPESHHAQSAALAERIRGGLNWYELVPALEDLAVLMQAVVGSGQHEFEEYLRQLNERLANFQGSLVDAQEGYVDGLASARELDSDLRQQVTGLHSSVQEANDLSGLKQVIESRLEGLLHTMDEYQRQRDQREEQVAGRLQTLVERVASMAQEAKGFRENLEEQRQKALVDALTGLPNRAAWNERLEIEGARWQRYGGELLMAVLDVDHFKRINDEYGHLAGDKVLKIIAGELAKRVRVTDFIARFGGEEFVLLMPSTPMEGGLKLLDVLRTAIEACPFHFKGQPVTITLSGGLAAYHPGEVAEQVFERADQALYRAKRGGRNRIESERYDACNDSLSSLGTP
ncbi:diguanylate cyclase [Pseudomonas kuykendallii]|uniref:diguanylate cyclase n=1 Tax=Pseudomonas kuykendallii TaxID=1007099 RepID=A0A1H2SB31_9PSED|nr:GGDEF domain-containing protein [Pseudomonas kuykendallii]MCQ4270461.1 diguanylate cyclase [Pseudomonas kuykendallii]SDW28209.1 diguanylate cyclase [Pseudomonas kuykendallii]